MKNILLLVVVLFFSCKKEPFPVGEPCSPVNVHYNKVQSIVSASCGDLSTACHSSASQAFQFNYDNAKAYAPLITFRINRPRTSEDRMPPGGPGLTECQINTIEAWVKEGCKK